MEKSRTMGLGLKSRCSVLGLLLIFGTIGCKGQVCKNTQWNDKDEPCPAGYEEIYRDQDGTQSLRQCCDPNHENFKSYKYTGIMCRATPCGSGRNPHLCIAFDDRYVEGKKLEYEEMFREPCTKPNGSPGVTGLCCRKNSTEGVLVTTLGAEQNEFPHIAKLLTPGHCGGTIYNDKYIVTAAHCIVNSDTKTLTDVSEMKVKLGTNIGDTDSKEYVYYVKKATPHPKYSRLLPNEEAKKERSRIFNDIALLELNRSITFGPNVKMMQIAPQGFEPLDYANNAVIVGWGTTYTSEISVHLQKANFLIRKDSSCFASGKRYQNVKEMPEQLLCVGGILEGKWSPTAGRGDSGGPAVCRDSNGQAILCGVTSFGGDDQKCLDNNDEVSCPPSVFAEVGHFQSWIEGIAGKQDLSSPHLFRPYLYGQKVSPGEYEHQVSVTSQGGKNCGGTLVAENIVITASQCAYTDNNQPRAGITITTQKGEKVPAISAVNRSGFKRVGDKIDLEKQGNHIRMTDNFYKDDLAMLKLQKKVQIAPGKLAKIPTADHIADYGIEISRSREEGKGDYLMQREFTILDRGECKTRMKRLSMVDPTVSVDKNLLCGVEKYSGGSLCDRELGGGLICKGEDGEDVLCGVQVFRLCEWSIPNGFMNIGRLEPWVTQVMKMMTK